MFCRLNVCPYKTHKQSESKSHTQDDINSPVKVKLLFHDADVLYSTEIHVIFLFNVWYLKWDCTQRPPARGWKTDMRRPFRRRPTSNPARPLGGDKHQDTRPPRWQNTPGTPLHLSDARGRRKVWNSRLIPSSNESRFKPFLLLRREHNKKEGNNSDGSKEGGDEGEMSAFAAKNRR